MSREEFFSRTLPFAEILYKELRRTNAYENEAITIAGPTIDELERYAPELAVRVPNHLGSGIQTDSGSANLIPIVDGLSLEAIWNASARPRDNLVICWPGVKLDRRLPKGVSETWANALQQAEAPLAVLHSLQHPSSAQNVVISAHPLGQDPNSAPLLQMLFRSEAKQTRIPGMKWWNDFPFLRWQGEENTRAHVFIQSRAGEVLWNRHEDARSPARRAEAEVIAVYNSVQPFRAAIEVQETGSESSDSQSFCQAHLFGWSREPDDGVREGELAEYAVWSKQGVRHKDDLAELERAIRRWVGVLQNRSPRNDDDVVAPCSIFWHKRTWTRPTADEIEHSLRSHVAEYGHPVRTLEQVATSIEYETLGGTAVADARARFWVFTRDELAGRAIMARPSDPMIEQGRPLRVEVADAWFVVLALSHHLVREWLICRGVGNLEGRLWINEGDIKSFPIPWPDAEVRAEEKQQVCEMRILASAIGSMDSRHHNELPFKLFSPEHDGYLDDDGKLFLFSGLGQSRRKAEFIADLAKRVVPGSKIAAIAALPTPIAAPLIAKGHTESGKERSQQLIMGSEAAAKLWATIAASQLRHADPTRVESAWYRIKAEGSNWSFGDWVTLARKCAEGNPMCRSLTSGLDEALARCVELRNAELHNRAGVDLLDKLELAVTALVREWGKAFNDRLQVVVSARNKQSGVALRTRAFSGDRMHGEPITWEQPHGSAASRLREGHVIWGDPQSYLLLDPWIISRATKSGEIGLWAIYRVNKNSCRYDRLWVPPAEEEGELTIPGPFRIAQ